MTTRSIPLPDFIEDIEYLLSWRTYPPEVAQRLGYTVDTVARRLQRAGRFDLARVFTPYDTRKHR